MPIVRQSAPIRAVGPNDDQVLLRRRGDQHEAFPVGRDVANIEAAGALENRFRPSDAQVPRGYKIRFLPFDKGLSRQ